MKILFSIIWFFLFLNIALFWLWLWQLKNYHYKRFKAHFESNAWRKFMVSFKGGRLPKITLKIIFLSILFLCLSIFFLYLSFSNFDGWFFYGFLILLLLFSSLVDSIVILLIQGPTILMIKLIIFLATQKIKKQKDLIVIGVTGSYGKTTTKEFLFQFLASQFKTIKTDEHLNAEVGIAKTILNKLNSSHKIFIVEMGAYERGKIKQVSKMVQPQIGILTGINEQHLAMFGSQENIIKAKYELIEALPENGLAVFNGNNMFCRKLYEKTKKEKAIIGTERSKLENNIHFDLWAENIIVGKDEISFEVKSENKKEKIKSFVSGVHNLENILLGFQVALHLGIPLRELKDISLKLKSRKGALKLQRGERGLNILDASYSANPQGVISHLNHLNNFSKNKIIVFHPMIELGQESKRIHSKVGEKMGEVGETLILTRPDFFEAIKEGAIKGGLNEKNIFLIPLAEDISKKLKEISKTGDTILFENIISQKVISEFLKK